MKHRSAIRKYHAPIWNEPVITQMGSDGRRGLIFRESSQSYFDGIGSAQQLLPEGMYREDKPSLPELSEHEVQRHYLHLSQETLGMMGISLFGTCTMKYNPRLNEIVTARPEVAETHPLQHEETLQGTLHLIHNFDLILRIINSHIVRIIN